ncbi:MAG TPA: glycine zipper 2TM domain-containing protein [Rhodanobacteraceae bacterium]|nr:glycine zipper 2TM domain-containing protein [Rhodanobacteraceae bacterium]
MNKAILSRSMCAALGVTGAVVLAGCGSAADANAVEYAQVTQVKPITRTTSTPRQECKNVEVEHRSAPKDKHEIVGTAIGAIVGGVAGNQVGGGNGKKLATVAGAVAGGYAGKKIEEAHQQPQISTSVEQHCTTVADKHTEVVAYDVTYNYNGTSHHARMQHKPGDRIQIKQGVVVVDGGGAAD